MLSLFSFKSVGGKGKRAQHAINLCQDASFFGQFCKERRLRVLQKPPSSLLKQLATSTLFKVEIGENIVELEIQNEKKTRGSFEEKTE